MAETGSRTKGAIAGAGIVAALGGVAARSADDFALAGCRATRTATIAGEGVTAGGFARTGSGLADDGLRGVGRAGLSHADDGVVRGRPWMIAAGEGDDGLRLGSGSTLDDIATRRGTSVGEAHAPVAEGPSVGETAVDVSMEVLDLSTDALTPDPEPARDTVRLPGTLGLATTPVVRAPVAVLIQNWSDAPDGGGGVPQLGSVARVDGAEVAKRGWSSVLRALPRANPLVILASSRDVGSTLELAGDHRTGVSELHARCTSEGRHCVTMLCPAEQDEPSSCVASLPDVFDRTARAASAMRANQDMFVGMLGRARATWDATNNVSIAHVKLTWEGGQDGSFRPQFRKLAPLY